MDVACDPSISAESIYTWRRKDRIDRGMRPGLTSADKSELTAATHRIAELEALMVSEWGYYGTLSRPPSVRAIRQA
jgi:hypothetical protein